MNRFDSGALDRLEEGEASFSDLVEDYGEGPEAKCKGLIGPIPVGQIQPPELVNLLRSSKSEKFIHRSIFGEWHVLLRLESLQPARLDDDMKKHLLNVQLNAFLEERVQRRLKGEFLPQLDYDPEL